MKKYLYLAWPLATIILTFIVLRTMLMTDDMQAMLFRGQELSIWLPTETYRHTLDIYPGGFLSWLGCYLTQYFYEPQTGITYLALAWAAITALTIRLFRLKKGWTLLGALPAMLLMTCLVQTGYWIYLQKLQGHLWVPTLGVLFSLLAANVFSAVARLRQHSQRFIQLAATLVGYYWMYRFGVWGYNNMGAWMFLGIALMALSDIDTADNVPLLKRFRWAGYAPSPYTVVTIVLAVVLYKMVPEQAYYHFNQTHHEELYNACLPLTQYSIVKLTEFQTPYKLLAGSFVLMAAVQTIGLCCKKAPTEKLTKNKLATAITSRTWAKALTTMIIPIACILLCHNYMQKRWYRDTTFYAELKMNHCIEMQDWQGVLDISHKSAEAKTPPTRMMTMYKNLALFRLGRAGWDMFQYPEGGTQHCLCGRVTTSRKELDTKTGEVVDIPVHADGCTDHEILPIKMTQVCGKQLYFQYGKENFCYRWCMEDGVEFGFNIDVLRLMTKASLVNEDWEVAKKYLNILTKTRNYHDWAEHYRPFLYNVELMKQDPEFKAIWPMAQYGDRLDGDNTMIELYLLQTFANGMGADDYYQENTLICAMIMKDIDLFWPRFREYINRHNQQPDFKMPRYYEEAAYLYIMLEPQRPSQLWPGITNQQSLQYIPFSDQVKKNYDEFMKMNESIYPGIHNRVQARYAAKMQQARGNEQQTKLMEARFEKEFNEELAQAFKPRFGNTFFYFYYLIRNQKTN